MDLRVRLEPPFFSHYKTRKDDFASRNSQPVQGNLYTGGRLLYRLCSCQPTVELPVGVLENIFLQLVNNQALTTVDNCTYGTIPFPLYIDFPGQISPPDSGHIGSVWLLALLWSQVSKNRTLIGKTSCTLNNFLPML